MGGLEKIKASVGKTFPLGLKKDLKGWNVAFYAGSSSQVELGLFESGSLEPGRLFPMQKLGEVWCLNLQNVPENTEYAFLSDGAWLLDPYAKLLNTSSLWRKAPKAPLRAQVELPAPFQWGEDKRPHHPKNKLLIYEMHVRGFTAHPSSNTKNAGTYLGVIEKIPYLLELGVNAVELLPIFEFDENKLNAGKLPNYWGYQPISWFMPKRAFGTVNEFKTMVKELHKAGIEVILDVVYNHTGDAHFHPSYYLHNSHGKLLDYTGCGNTISANQPNAEQLILESLRYWVEEMHVDGFRFDLASIFTRGIDGHVLAHPPILVAIAADPVFKEIKLIAEAWDAAGLYQLNFFPHFGPWSEWNGLYRDVVRRFIKGTDGKVSRFASVLSGSDITYSSTKTPTSSINFITAHDGFCLRDLVTYQDKHNQMNGENNQDGNNQNDNWNCGAEGTTDAPEILSLREKQMRNFWLALLIAQGVPMILMGDEYGHTREGNNNPYVQDNEVNWFLWDECKKNQEMMDFVQSLIAFRKAHPELSQDRFLTSHDIVWHGVKVRSPDWSNSSRFIAFNTQTVPRLYVAFNAGFEPVQAEIPEGIDWELVVNTSSGWSEQWFKGGGAGMSGSIEMEPYSALVLKEKI
jgi:isoamylase/glycogen operon protein